MLVTPERSYAFQLRRLSQFEEYKRKEVEKNEIDIESKKECLLGRPLSAAGDFYLCSAELFSAVRQLLNAQFREPERRTRRQLHSYGKAGCERPLPNEG
jgi:hypothetical protein